MIIDLIEFFQVKNFFKEKLSINLTYFTNNSIKIPLPDNSIDIVTTLDAIEPNKNDANKILMGLWRIAKKYYLEQRINQQTRCFSI